MSRSVWQSRRTGGQAQSPVDTIAQHRALESPRPAVPTRGPGPSLRLSGTGAAALLFCQVHPASPCPPPFAPPPCISQDCSKTAFYSRTTEKPQMQTLPGDPTSSNSFSFNSWIQHTFPETLPCPALRGRHRREGPDAAQQFSDARGGGGMHRCPSCGRAGVCAHRAVGVWGTEEERIAPLEGM